MKIYKDTLRMLLNEVEDEDLIVEILLTQKLMERPLNTSCKEIKHKIMNIIQKVKYE